MKSSLLERLASPCCAGPLRLDIKMQRGSEIEEGALVCAVCSRAYPITAGIPRLRENREILSRTQESFSWEWTRYPGSRPEDRAVFLEESQLSARDFQGKLVLDAGCGMGRYSLVVRAWGAEVVALDLSESLDRLMQAARSDPHLHVVQGDLLRPPFKKDSFDMVYSHGVLHHTPDTRQAFRALAPLVKPGGLLSVWLYGKAGRFKDFATNPLRPGRGGIGRHRRLAWLIVAIRQLISDSLRFFTTRLPLAVTYALCYPLAALGAVPGLKYLTFSVETDFKVRLIEDFDWLSPPFQFHHTKEELSAWFVEAGYDILKVLPHGLVPKPGILGRRKQT